MGVALRLSRGGSKKRPFFRIVAADIRSPRDGRYLERLGTYNPMMKKDDPSRVTLNTERIKYWLSVGAKPSERVQKFLAKEKLAEMPKINTQTKQDKPRKKTLEKIKAKEEKIKAKEEMQKSAEAATQPAAEKPAEAATQPAAEKPAEAATQPAAEKPAEAATEPAAEKPAEAATQPAAEKPAEAATQPAAEKPAEAAAQPAAEKPAEAADLLKNLP